MDEQKRVRKTNTITGKTGTLIPGVKGSFIPDRTAEESPRNLPFSTRAGNFLKAVGTEVPKEVLNRAPYLAQRAMSGFTGGFSDPVVSATGTQQQPQDNIAKVGGFAAEMGGMMNPYSLALKGANLVGGFTQKAVSSLKNPLLRGAARVTGGGLQGATIGGLAPTPSGNPLDVGERYEQAKTGFKFGAAAEPVIAGMQKVAQGGRATVDATKGIFKSAKNVFTPKVFAKSIIKKFDAEHTARQTQFGSEIDEMSARHAAERPNDPISLRPVFQDLKDNIQGVKAVEGEGFQINPKPKILEDIARYAKRSGDPTLMKYVNNPELAESLTLKEAQAIKRSLTNAAPRLGKYLQGNLSGDLDDVLRVYRDAFTDIRRAEISAAPEAEALFKDYASYIDSYNQVKSRFDMKRILPNLQKGFPDVGGKGPGMIESEVIPKTLPKETVKEMRGFRRGTKTAKAGAALLGTGIGAKILKEVID